MFKFYEPMAVDTVQLHGREYELDLSFNRVLSSIDWLQDEKVNIYQRLDIAISLLLSNQKDLPESVEEQVELLNTIIETHIKTEGHDAIVYDVNGDPMPVAGKDEEDEQVYSFKYDSEYIWTSFMQAYHIDLHDEIGVMHWKKFVALFRDLPDDTKMKDIIKIRQWEPDGESAKHQAQMRELQDYYRLPNKSEKGGDEWQTD